MDKENIVNKNIVIKSIENIGQGQSLIRTGENTYTGIISLDEINQHMSNLVKVEIQWIDDGNNDEEDTKLASRYEMVLRIPVKVHVCQYLGEEVTEYEEETPDNI